MSGEEDEFLAGDGKRPCPWCDDYFNSFVRKHAAQAHPDKWREWKNAE